MTCPMPISASASARMSKVSRGIATGVAIGIHKVVDSKDRHVSLLTLAQSLLPYMRIQKSKFGLVFHKIQYLVPAKVVPVPKMPVNRAYHFQILGHVQSPATVAVIRFVGDLDYFEQFWVLIQIRRDMYSLMFFRGGAPGALEGVGGEHLNIQTTRVS